MRKFLILTATTAALAAAPAFAQDVTGTVNVTGEVAPRCQFTVDSVVLPLGELALSSNGELDTAKVDDETANLAGWCNGSSAQIKVEAFPLVGPSFTGDTAAFTNTVNYTATATANSVSPTDTTTTPGAGSPLSVGIFSGQIQVKLSGSDAASKKLVAGDYTGSVVVTLTPNVVPVQTEL